MGEPEINWPEALRTTDGDNSAAVATLRGWLLNGLRVALHERTDVSEAQLEDFTQDELRGIFEEQSNHTKIGLEYLPAFARRLHHCRDLAEPEPFDFLTWFEFAKKDTAEFDQLMARLRASAEWKYVERQVELRFTRDLPRRLSPRRCSKDHGRGESAHLRMVLCDAGAASPPLRYRRGEAGLAHGLTQPSSTSWSFRKSS